MSRKGENIYLRKDGRWEGRYIKGRKVDGKPIFGSIYGRQYAEVKKRLVLIKAELYQSETSILIFGSGTLKDWTEFWLENVMRPHLKPGTYAGYQRNIQKHILPSLGPMLLRKMAQGDIQNFANRLVHTMASSTLQGICRLLKAILTSAWHKGLIDKNPYYEIKFPKSPPRTPRVLTKTEQKKIEHSIKNSQELEYLLCLYTGIRVGELAALRWEDIDFENRLLHIRHSVQRIPSSNGNTKTRLFLGTPKSEHSLRDIPIPIFLMPYLENRKNSAAFPSASPFVFANKQGGYKDPRTFQRRISQLCKNLGILGVHMHTLRHSFAVRCLEHHIRYEILAELLGHASAQITIRHYVHCTEEDKRRSMDLLSLNA